MAKVGLIWHAPKRNPFDAARYIDEITEAVEELGEEVKEDFEDVVSDWRTQVTFRKLVRVEADAVSLNISPATNANIWGYVDKGTRPHIIRSKRGKKLAFNTGYSARTKPGRAHVGSGTASGPRVFADLVHHPGSEPRNFTTTILNKYKSELTRVIRQAIRDAK